MITPELLRSIPLFDGLGEADLQAIASVAADIQLQPDEWLVREGEVSAFFVLLSGDLEVTKILAGVEQVIDHYHPNEFFGEVPLLLGSSILANLRAMNEVRVLRLDATEFHELLPRSEKVAATIMRKMSWRVGNLQRFSLETQQETSLIIGSGSDLLCHDLRDFFSRNRLNYRWLEPENPLEAALIPSGVSEDAYPAVVLPDGTILKCPSNREVADKLGLHTAPLLPEYDVVIIGGGPAGLAAAVYGASEGLQTLMVEREAPGGQAGTSSRIENYLGFPTGLSGDDLGTRALQQAKRFGTEIVVARAVNTIRIDEGNGRKVVVLEAEDGAGEAVTARTVILATGVSWRSLNVSGADKLVGRGIYYGAARTEAPRVRGKDVYLIGGGNSAGQAAMFFASYARSVTLLIRATTIEAGMSQYLVNQLATKQNVNIALSSEVVEVHGQGLLEAITVQNRVTKATERYQTDSLFVFIGAEAETSWLPVGIERDERGYILTGPALQADGKWTLERDPYLLETSIAGIFAAGDVRHGSIKRVASGVGEGSIAIAFVHQYLAEEVTVSPPVTSVAAS